MDFKEKVYDMIESTDTLRLRLLKVLHDSKVPANTVASLIGLSPITLTKFLLGDNRLHAMSLYRLHAYIIKEEKVIASGDDCVKKDC